MRILHILWGFSPWREGGLVLYAEDIMDAQNLAGHRVAAFFAGRRGLWGKPSLYKWARGDVTQYEIQNAPLVHLGRRGTFPVAGELGEPCSEQFFKETLEDFKPDIVHVHELAGLPFTILDICRERNLPLILTLHDYFPLCPALNLYDRQGRLCEDTSGTGCVVCCGNGPDGGLRDRIRTLNLGGRSKWLFATPLLFRYAWDRLFCRTAFTTSELRETYRRRHELNRIRLRHVDVIIAQSSRTKEIYEQRTGRTDIQLAHSSLSHIEQLTPRRMKDVLSPVRFATLNGAMAPYKGAEILDQCVKILKHRGYEGAYRLDIFGGIYREVKRSLRSSPSVQWHGNYPRFSLNEMLSKVDVGIVPSLCEEVYGYVGIEFLAKGIPVIGNRRGGIVDYTLNGCTGWVNDACTAEGLADIMERIINEPDCILPLNQWIVDNRGKVIANRKEHLRTVLQYYEQAIAMRMDGGK